ncbi:MAG: SEC-C domain-containing protein [Pirellulales bacterium]|nr:SEC-C domain-containing protein [Pirellulales bacterium]
MRPCPCGSGKKYKHCCIRKGFDWMEAEDGEIFQSFQLSDETTAALEELRQAQIDRLGYEPEYIFEGAPPLELIEHWTVEAMKKGGVEPALIYAYEKTNGLMLNEHNQNMVPDSDIAEWEAAIDEYERTTGKTASRRRLNDRDFRAVMRHGPKDKPAPQFVERLPLRPPFEQDEWGKKHWSDLRDDPACFEYFQECLAEITRRGRAETYLDMFLLMTKIGDGPRTGQDLDRLLHEARQEKFTTSQLKYSLKTIEKTYQPGVSIPTAAAAFEFLAFVGNFMTAYAEHEGIAAELDEILQQIHRLTVLAFVSAVNAELGVDRDIWKK